MVYYVEDQVSLDWSIIIHLKPRDLCGMDELIDNEMCKHELFIEQEMCNFFIMMVRIFYWQRKRKMMIFWKAPIMEPMLKKIRMC